MRQAQKARPETLRQFFRQHNSSRSDSIERRVQEIRNAVPATQDAAVTDSCSTAALAWVRILRELRETIASYDQKSKPWLGNIVTLPLSTLCPE